MVIYQPPTATATATAAAAAVTVSTPPRLGLAWLGLALLCSVACEVDLC
jgi:hypothetical protein